MRKVGEAMSKVEKNVKPEQVELPSRSWSKHTSCSIDLGSSLRPHLPWF
jgi:hypothetical protein